MRSLTSYKDLDVWKNGHNLVLSIYKETKAFPSSEQFGLTNQMRRSAVSITSNIAEGFARRNKKEKVQFYYMALGSANELESQIQIAHDISYLSLESFNKLTDQTRQVIKLLHSLIRSTKNKS